MNREKILTGGNELAVWLIRKLGGDFARKWPPTMSFREALRTIPDDCYEVWVCWAIIMQERDNPTREVSYVQ